MSYHARLVHTIPSTSHHYIITLLVHYTITTVLLHYYVTTLVEMVLSTDAWHLDCSVRQTLSDGNPGSLEVSLVAPFFAQALHNKQQQQQQQNGHENKRARKQRIESQRRQHNTTA